MLASRLLRALLGGSGGWHAAEQKGERLLKANLTPAQLQQYERYCFFDVIGGDTGLRYRVRRGTALNIEVLDANDDRVKRWCFYPVGNLAMGDVLLAQKLALELFETQALAIANQFPIVHLPQWSGRPSNPPGWWWPLEQAVARGQTELSQTSR